MAILLVRATDSNVTGPGQWLAGQISTVYDDSQVIMGDEDPSAGIFYNITVTDRTREQAQVYLEDWKHHPTIQQISANGNTRLVEIASTMVSATGKNAFTAAGVANLISFLNSEYPTANASLDSWTNTTFRIQITIPASAYEAFSFIVYGFVRQMQYARRRWYVTSAGLTALSNNGGALSGTAAQVGAYLRDGLLD